MSVAAAGVSSYFNYLANQETNEQTQANVRNTNIANLEIAKLNNAANKEMTEQTNATNLQIARETNELQRAESEKAYQRSTQTNQIAELMRAGFSAQQAKQIVASSGSAAAYSPAAIQMPTMLAPRNDLPAAMQAANVNPFQLDTGAITSSVAQNLQGIAQDFMNPNGGAMGNIFAENGINTVMSKIDKVPSSVISSPTSFLTWLDSDGKSIFSDKESKIIRSAFGTPYGSRAMMSQMRNLSSMWSDKQRIALQEEQYKQSRIQTKIMGITRQLEVVKLDSMKIQNEISNWNLKLKPIEYNTIAEELLDRFNKASANVEIWEKPEFKNAFIRNTLLNEDYRSFFLTAAKFNEQAKSMAAEQSVEYMSEHAAMFGIYNLFKEYGMTSTNIGAAVAALAASSGDVGFDVLSWINQFFIDTPDSYVEQSKHAKPIIEKVVTKTKNSLDEKYESIVK